MNITLNGKKGGIAIVSKNDFESVKKYQWHQNQDGYAQGNISGVLMLMYRYIMKVTNRDQIIDHINGNRLDNRRDNLRLTDVQLNSENKKLNKNKKTSIYRGVFFDKKNKKFQVTTNIGGKRLNMGCYDTETKAAEVFDMYIVHEDLNHVTLNFPEKRNEYLKRDYKRYIKNKQCNYIGVRTNRNKFLAKLEHSGKIIYIKTSDDDLVCAKAYDKYIVDNNIPGKKINFPKDHPNYNPSCTIKSKYKPTDNDNIVQLIINKHPDEQVLIDKIEYDNIKNYAWCLSNGYVKGRINKKSILLHRFIMKVTNPNIFIDHIDGNILNNCKNNLRLSDSQKNSHNKSKPKNKSSKYLGVSYNKSRNT
jgi:hypothetical protein